MVSVAWDARSLAGISVVFVFLLFNMGNTLSSSISLDRFTFHLKAFFDAW